LPEIIWQVDVKREQIKIDCAACGNHSLLKHGHKLITYILKNPPAAKGAKSLKSPSSKKEKKNKKSKGGDSEEEEEEEDESQDGAGHQAHIAGQSIMDANAAALKAAAAARVEDDIEEWGEDTSKEARAQRRADEMKAMAADAPKVDDAVEKMLALALSTKEKDSPVYVLRRFILQAPHSVTQVCLSCFPLFRVFYAYYESNFLQIMAELRRLELARNLTPSQKMRACIEALLDTQQPKAVLSQLKQHEAVIKKLAADKLQLSTLFGAFEEVLGVVDGGALLPRTSHILQALYEADIFDEDFMLCWFESPPESSLTVPRPVAVELRKKAEPFIEWLKTADDDDDDESDDE
jgi:translation initiation factor 5